MKFFSMFLLYALATSCLNENEDGFDKVKSSSVKASSSQNNNEANANNTDSPSAAAVVEGQPTSTFRDFEGIQKLSLVGADKALIEWIPYHNHEKVGFYRISMGLGSNPQEWEGPVKIESSQVAYEYDIKPSARRWIGKRIVSFKVEILGKNGQLHKNEVLKSAEFDFPNVGYGVSINNGDPHSSETLVNLNFVYQNAIEMKVSSNSVCAGGSWEAFSSSKYWQFNGDGLNGVSVLFKEGNGFESACFTGSINIAKPLVDDQAPSDISVAINSGDEVTKKTAVTLALAAIDASPISVYVTNTPGCSEGGLWSNYVESMDWELSADEEIGNVFVKYRDSLGNESECISDDIVIDLNIPRGSILINNGDEVTTDLNVSLSITSNDLLADMYITNDENCESGGFWKPLATSEAWILGEVGVVTSVYVKFRNKEGLSSVCYGDSIQHEGDMSIPGPPIVTSSLTNPVSVSNPVWAWSSNGDLGNGNFRVKLNDANLNVGALETRDFNFSGLNLSDGDHTLFVQEQADSGLWSPSGTYTIKVDLTVPVASFDGLPLGETNSNQILVNVHPRDDIEFYQYAVITDGQGCSRATYSSPISVDQPIEERIIENGTYRLCVIAIDYAGNTQDVSQATSESWTIFRSWNLTVRPTVDNPSFTFRVLVENGDKLYIDWGDQNITTREGSLDSVASTEVSHTYGEVDTTYTVKIYGKATAINFKHATCSSLIKFSSVIEGIQNLVNLNELFDGCQSLTGSIPEGLFSELPNLKLANKAFHNSSLTGIIPVKLFSENPELERVFGTFSNTQLDGKIPADLFEKNRKLTNVGLLFYKSPGFTESIPAELFSRNPLINGFYRVFGDASGLTGKIPASLFANARDADSFFETFAGASGLTGSIPSDLFAKNPNVETFFGVFRGASGLTGEIPAELFDQNTLATSFAQAFEGASGLTGQVPAGLLNKNVNIQFMFGFLKNTTGITSISEDFLKGDESELGSGSRHYPDLINLSGVFAGMNPEIRNLPRLWDYFSDSVDLNKNGAFSGNTDPAVPVEWK